MEYLRGVRELTYPDITAGIFWVVYEDRSEILRVYNRVLGSMNLSQKSLQEISEKEIDILIKNYDRLGYLLNSNNQENSTIYYLQNDDIDNVKWNVRIIIVDCIISIYGYL